MTASAALVSGPSGPSPVRRPGSVRRTASIDATWAGGFGSPATLAGRARDVLSGLDGQLVVLAESTLDAVVGGDRVITRLTTVPARPQLAGLVGTSAGSGLRGRLKELVPDDRTSGEPLYLLLDDLAGASLVAGFAWLQWPHLVPDEVRARVDRGSRDMTGICAGFRPGSSGLGPTGSARFIHDLRAVPSLRHPEDPDGWHETREVEGVAMRRSRRIDVAVEGGVVRVDAMFQDSCTVPAGGRVAVHEYCLTATADARTGVLLSADADPRVLPYLECTGAAPNVGLLVGTPLADLRERVLDVLAGTLGCTHLNDALRALAEVPVLVAPLLDSG